MIQPTNSSVGALNPYKATEQKQTQTKAAATETVKKEQTTDTFEKTPIADKEIPTYSKPKKDYSKEVTALLEQHEQQMLQFKQSIMGMVTKQGQVSNVSIFNLNLTVTAEQSQAAKAAISEGGEWSVDAVAGRIMDMAQALSGGDTSKLDLLKKAVVDGFKAAGFDPDNRKGSGMPDITSKTYDEVMKRFDAWENSKTDASTETETE